jgi:hypothetical protein
MKEFGILNKSKNIQIKLIEFRAFTEKEMKETQEEVNNFLASSDITDGDLISITSVNRNGEPYLCITYRDSRPMNWRKGDVRSALYNAQEYKKGWYQENE